MYIYIYIYVPLSPHSLPALIPLGFLIFGRTRCCTILLTTIAESLQLNLIEKLQVAFSQDLKIQVMKSKKCV